MRTHIAMAHGSRAGEVIAEYGGAVTELRDPNILFYNGKIRSRMDVIRIVSAENFPSKLGGMAIPYPVALAHELGHSYSNMNGNRLG